MSIWYPGYGTSFSKYLLLETKVGRDLAGPIQKGSDNIATKVSEQTRSIVANNNQLKQILGDRFNSVSNSINWGFDRIEYALQDVNSSIESLHSDFNYGIALILEQAHVSNELLTGLINKLDDINRTLQNPTLNESREFYKIGCVRLSKGLLDKALDSFIEAEKKNDTDVFTQFYIGKLYLYGINKDANVIDLDKAKQHLLYAARYAKSEKIVDYSFVKIEAEAYLHASISIYAQLGEISIKENPVKIKELLSEALQIIQKAISLNPKLTEAYYHSAIYSALLNDSSSAIEYLEKAIEIDRNYTIKVGEDGAFDNIRSEIVSFLNALKEKRKVECFSRAQDAETFFSEAMQWHLEDSLLHNEFKKCQTDIADARRLLQLDTIFGYLDALSLYNKLISTLPGLIKRRINIFKGKIINNIYNTNIILSKLENHSKYSKYIDETKVHLNNANSCFYKNVSYLILMNALQETKDAYDKARKAVIDLNNEKTQQKEAKNKAIEDERYEENRRREIERVKKIKNDASLSYAGSMATILGIIGLLGGCVSCVDSGAYGDGFNWNFLPITIICAVTGAVIGGIAGQFKNK